MLGGEFSLMGKRVPKGNHFNCTAKINCKMCDFYTYLTYLENVNNNLHHFFSFDFSSLTYCLFPWPVHSL